MAYDARAANRIHSAEISSPRESARTDQQTAPTTATAPQTAIDLGVIFRLRCFVGVVVDMAAPHTSQRLPDGSAAVRTPFRVDYVVLISPVSGKTTGPRTSPGGVPGEVRDSALTWSSCPSRAHSWLVRWAPQVLARSSTGTSLISPLRRPSRKLRSSSRTFG